MTFILRKAQRERSNIFADYKPETKCDKREGYYVKYDATVCLNMKQVPKLNF